MKKTNILYWSFTLPFVILMGLGAIPDLISSKDAADIFAQIHFPAYMMPFLGAAKILGVIAILIPGNYPRIKEWAYAGLFFDLIGAFYAAMQSGGDPKSFFMFIFIGLLFASYYFYHRRLKMKAAASSSLR